MQRSCQAAGFWINVTVINYKEQIIRYGFPPEDRGVGGGGASKKRPLLCLLLFCDSDAYYRSTITVTPGEAYRVHVL